MRVLAVLALMCVTARGDSETDILKRYGVLPEKQDLSRYLRTLYPDAAMLKVVEELVSGLGSDRPARRVEASRGLARLGAAPIHALEAAARDFDPEVARDKTVKERFKGLRGPYSFYRIDNGNWLICLPGSDRVVELTPSGKEVWSIGKLGWPASACRLASGATVIAHRGGLEKILPSGARSWLLRVNSGTVFVSRY